MPTYEYECRACGHTFEEFQSMSAGALRKCPKCKKLKLQRLVGTGAGIIFKGSGFYETDYKRKGEAKKDEGGTSKQDGSKDKGGSKPQADSSSSGKGGGKSESGSKSAAD